MNISAYGEEGTSFLWRIEDVDPPDAWRAEPQAQVSLTPGTYTLTFVVRRRVEGDTLHLRFSSLTGSCGDFGPVPDPLPAPGSQFKMTGHVGCVYIPPQP